MDENMHVFVLFCKINIKHESTKTYMFPGKFPISIVRFTVFFF